MSRQAEQFRGTMIETHCGEDMVEVAGENLWMWIEFESLSHADEVFMSFIKYHMIIFKVLRTIDDTKKKLIQISITMKL